MQNFVIVKHIADNGKYLFRVPKAIDLFAGDTVVCDTRRGNVQLGVCLCDSFFANPETMYPLFQTQEKDMRWVTGTVAYHAFSEAQEEEDDKDGQQEYGESV